MTAPPPSQASGSFDAHKWVTLGLVIPVGVISGIFGALLAIADAASRDVTVRGHVVLAVSAALLLLVGVRSMVVGFLVSEEGVRVRGVWATRKLPRADVAGFVMECDAAGQFHFPAVVATDGRRIRARWAFTRARGGSAARAQEIVDAFTQLGWYDEARLDTALNTTDAVRRDHITTFRWHTPPGWPVPPTGWRPHPGWHPPPMWPPAPPDWEFWERRDIPVVDAADIEADPDEAPATTPEHLDPHYALDLEIAKGLPNSNWGLGEAFQAFGWLALLIALLIPVGIFVSSRAADVLIETSIGVAVFLAARKAAGQSGGWKRALGWELPKLRDTWFGFRWFGWNFLGSRIVTIIIALITLPLAGESESNVDVTHHDSVVTIILLILVAVIIAPIVEEFFFRGLLLRATMRRFSFWPSAVVTSVLFGAAHVPQVDNARSRLIVGFSIATFGLLQAMLARRKARLSPNMWVHGFSNALVVALALL